jgi:hypothetical protein
MFLFCLSQAAPLSNHPATACNVQVTVGTADVTCNGACNGMAWAVPSGGTGPYSYTWSPGSGTIDTIKALCPGSYSVTVMDMMGCTAVGVATIHEPTAISLTMSLANSTCNGSCNGWAYVKATGGYPHYTYAWTPGLQSKDTAFNLCAGTYTATVKDSLGCMSAATAVISEPAALSLAFSNVKSVKCNGRCNGRATVSAGGGTAAYTYSWATGGVTSTIDSALCTGMAKVTVKDANGCSFQDSVMIGTPAPLIATTSQVNEMCFGDATGTASVTPSGGTAPYKYSWLPSPFPILLKAGPEVCIVTDSNGCRIFKPFNITQPPAIKPVISSKMTSCASCADGRDSVSVTGGAGPLSYAWSPGGCSTQVCTGLTAGSYTCCVTDSTGCRVCQSGTIDVTGISESETPSVYIYPNPAGDYLTLQLPASYEIRKLRVYAVSGELVTEIDQFHASVLDVSGLRAGTYVLQLDCQAGLLHKVFIKQ